MAIRYRVLPTRKAVDVPCATELGALLACFSATGDIRGHVEGTQGCAAAARGLQACMQKPHKGAKKAGGSINYLLRTKIKK